MEFEVKDEVRLTLQHSIDSRINPAYTHLFLYILFSGFRQEYFRGAHTIFFFLLNRDKQG